MKYLENLNPVIKTRSLDISLFLELWCHNTKGYHLVKKNAKDCNAVYI